MDTSLNFMPFYFRLDSSGRMSSIQLDWPWKQAVCLQPVAMLNGKHEHSKNIDLHMDMHDM